MTKAGVTADTTRGRAAGRGDRAFGALRERDFAVFWSAALVSNIGTWMQVITVPYVVDHLTHSTAAVGVGIFLTYFPALLVMPLAGALADRYPRRTVMLWAQTVPMAVALGLAAVWFVGIDTPIPIFVLVTIGSLAQGVTMPSWNALIPELVPRERMLNAIRLNTMQFTAARALGPALAGLVLTTLGAGAAFLTNGFSFVVVVVALAAIPPRPAAHDGDPGTMLEHFRDGLRYVRSREVLWLPALSSLVFVLVGYCSVQLAEPFTRRVLTVGAGQYGLLIAVVGLGAVAGSLFVVFNDHLLRSRLVVGALSVFVLADIAYGAAPGYAFAVGAAFVMGITQIICQMSLQTSVQAHVPDRYRGRAMSVYSLGFFGGAPFGALVGGLVASGVGLRATFIGGAVLLGVYTLFVVVRYDGLRLLDGGLDHGASPEPVVVPSVEMEPGEI